MTSCSTKAYCSTNGYHYIATGSYDYEAGRDNSVAVWRAEIPKAAQPQALSRASQCSNEQKPTRPAPPFVNFHDVGRASPRVVAVRHAGRRSTTASKASFFWPLVYVIFLGSGLVYVLSELMVRVVHRSSSCLHV